MSRRSASCSAYPRTLANLAQAVRRADIAMLYDSEDVRPGTHRMVALCRGSLTRVMHRPLPQWARTVLGPAVE